MESSNPNVVGDSLSEQAHKDVYKQGDPLTAQHQVERVSIGNGASPKPDLVSTITQALNKRQTESKHRHIAQFDQGSFDSRDTNDKKGHKRINTQPEVVYENQLKGQLTKGKPRYALDSNQSSG